MAVLQPGGVEATVLSARRGGQWCTSLLRDGAAASNPQKPGMEAAAAGLVFVGQLAPPRQGQGALGTLQPVPWAQPAPQGSGAWSKWVRWAPHTH